VITLTIARLDDEIGEPAAICRSQPDYWRVSGDQDPDAMTRESVEAMLREDAGAEGVPPIRLGVLDANEPAKPFWRALGFRRIDLRPDRAKGRPAIVLENALERPRLGP
jgi:hypothetical protein